MAISLTPPIQPTGESFRERPRVSPNIRQKTNSKVMGFVLEKIEDAGTRSGLLLSATSSRVMIGLLAALAMHALVEEREKQRVGRSNRRYLPKSCKNGVLNPK
jgi:hypothetical protein